MTTDFTKIRWAGQDCILVTVREHSREPILILCPEDVEQINRVWKKELRKDE